jgi:hypothetical protein
VLGLDVDGWFGLLVALVAGGGGAALLLLVFWRPRSVAGKPAKQDSDAS